MEAIVDKNTEFKIQALGHNVVVKPAEKKEISDGGIYLGDSAEAPWEGTVLSAGEKVEGISVGDVVLVPHMAGREINMRGNKVLALIDDEIILKYL